MRRMPLPPVAEDGDKEDRGRVLVVGASVRTPGAIWLAGIAALRAGAGKLQLATVESAALALGLAVPEALVLALNTNRTGEISPAGLRKVLARYVQEANAVLIGPGMASGGAMTRFASQILPDMPAEATLVLDAGAVPMLRRIVANPDGVPRRTIITPNIREMASLLGLDADDIERDPAAIARRTARECKATVVLKGATTWIADPRGELYCYKGGTAGLGTSGSGDTLAGIIAGLAARGADPVTAAVWGVNAHGSAGRALSRRFGKVGYLARDLLDVIPRFVQTSSSAKLHG